MTQRSGKQLTWEETNLELEELQRAFILLDCCPEFKDMEITKDLFRRRWTELNYIRIALVSKIKR